MTEGAARWWCSASSTSNPGSGRRAVAPGKVDGASALDLGVQRGRLTVGKSARATPFQSGTGAAGKWKPGAGRESGPGMLKVRAKATDARAGLSEDMTHPSRSSQSTELSSLC